MDSEASKCAYLWFLVLIKLLPPIQKARFHCNSIKEKSKNCHAWRRNKEVKKRSEVHLSLFGPCVLKAHKGLTSSTCGYFWLFGEMTVSPFTMGLRMAEGWVLVWTLHEQWQSASAAPLSQYLKQKESIHISSKKRNIDSAKVTHSGVLKRNILVLPVLFPYMELKKHSLVFSDLQYYSRLFPQVLCKL